MPRPTWHYTDVANLWAGDQAECCNKKTATISEDFPRMSILRREHVVSFNIPQESLKMRHYLKSCTTAACKWRHAWNKKMLTVHMFPSICIYICIRYIFFCSILQLCSPIPSKRQKTGKKTSIERLGSCCRTLRIASATSWCWNIHRQLPTANGPCGYVLQGIDVQSRVDPWQNFKTSDLDWST